MPAQIMKITVIIIPVVMNRDNALLIIAGALSGWGRLRGVFIVWPPTVSARYSIIYIQYNPNDKMSMPGDNLKKSKVKKDLFFQADWKNDYLKHAIDLRVRSKNFFRLYVLALCFRVKLSRFC